MTDHTSMISTPARGKDPSAASATPTRPDGLRWTYVIAVLACGWLVGQICIVAYVIHNPTASPLGFTYPDQQLGFFGMWDERVYYYMHEKLYYEPWRWLPVFVDSKLPLGPPVTILLLGKLTGHCKPVMWVLYAGLNLLAVVPLALFARWTAHRAIWFLVPLLFLVHPGPWRFYAGFTTEGPANTFLCCMLLFLMLAAGARRWFLWALAAGVCLFLASEFRAALRYAGYLALAMSLLWYVLVRFGPSRWRGAEGSKHGARIALTCLIGFMVPHLGLQGFARIADSEEMDNFYFHQPVLWRSVNPHVQGWRFDQLGIDPKTLILTADGRTIPSGDQIEAYAAWIADAPLRYVGLCCEYVWRMWVGDTRYLRGEWFVETLGMVGTLVFVALQVVAGLLLLTGIGIRAAQRRTDSMDLIGACVMAGYTVVVLLFRAKPEYGSCLIGVALALGLRHCSPARLAGVSLLSLAIVAGWGATTFSRNIDHQSLECRRSLPELAAVDLTPSNVTPHDCEVSFASEGEMAISIDETESAWIDIRLGDQRVPVLRNMVFAIRPSREKNAPTELEEEIQLAIGPEDEDVDRFAEHFRLVPHAMEMGFDTGTGAGEPAIAFSTSHAIKRQTFEMRDLGAYVGSVRLLFPPGPACFGFASTLSVRVLPTRPGMKDELEALQAVRQPRVTASAPAEVASLPPRFVYQRWPAGIEYEDGLRLECITLCSRPAEESELTWVADVTAADEETAAHRQVVFHLVSDDGAFVPHDARVVVSPPSSPVEGSAAGRLEPSDVQGKTLIRTGLALNQSPWTASRMTAESVAGFAAPAGTLIDVPLVHLTPLERARLQEMVGSRLVISPGVLVPAPAVAGGRIEVSARPWDGLDATRCALVFRAETNAPLSSNGILRPISDRYGVLLPAGGPSAAPVTTRPSSAAASSESPASASTSLHFPLPDQYRNRPQQIVPMDIEVETGITVHQLAFVETNEGGAELIADVRARDRQAASEDILLFRFLCAGPGIYAGDSVPEFVAPGFGRIRIQVPAEHLAIGTDIRMSVCSRNYIPQRDVRQPLAECPLGRFSEAGGSICFPLAHLTEAQAAVLREAAGGLDLVSNVLVANLSAVGWDGDKQITILPDPLQALGPGRAALLDMRRIPVEETPRIRRRRIVAANLWVVYDADPSFVAPKSRPTIREMLQLW